MHGIYKKSLGGQKKFSRVIFNEITKGAIENAFKNPTKINKFRINSQQARRFLDRIVGYMISPLLWKRISMGLSAGRVQSIAVRLIVEKEQKIKEFMPKKYWNLSAELITEKNILINMHITHKKNNKLKNLLKIKLTILLHL